MKLKSGEMARCPECDEEWDAEVDDFVIPNRVGFESEAVEKCIECDAKISVIKDADGTFDLSETA